MTPRLAMKSTATATQGYARLERKLALLNWLHRRLGYEDTRDLLREIKQINEGYNENDRSHISVHLASRSNQMLGLTSDDLQRYDDNLREHLELMNAGRTEKVTLRYFQYLAALYTEIFLDWYYNRPRDLLRSLNEFIAQYNATCPPDRRFEPFEQADLSKLAFWMATGSGKTLLLHLNYRQFNHYNRESLDNILLITPNEGLSQQHLDELQASNIPAIRFDVNEAGGLLSQPNTIRVTEITKLVDEKKGGGVRVPVEAFEGNNLIFVDEGHKGTSGEALARNARTRWPRQGSPLSTAPPSDRPWPRRRTIRSPHGVWQSHRLRLLLPSLLRRRLRQGLSHSQSEGGHIIGTNGHSLDGQSAVILRTAACLR